MPEKITVKQTTLEQAMRVDGLIPEFGKQYSEENALEKTRGKDLLFLVAYSGENPAGYIIAYDRYSDGSFYCWMAGVIPEFRGRGILKAMMAYLMGWAKKKGYDRIRIKTRNKRREMLNYLAKNDFDFLEIEKKDDVKEYRILAEKIL
ncbi:MAG: GNAT family N-acetyltransferase [Candidatus Woesearchaeota archaeon]